MQAHPVNRFISSLIGSSPAKSCVELVASTLKMGEENRAFEATSTANEEPDPPSAEIPSVQGDSPTCVDMPGIYEPLAFLKAHAIRLCDNILSVVKFSFESMRRPIFPLSVTKSSNQLFSCRIFCQLANRDFRIAILRRDQISVIRIRGGVSSCTFSILRPYSFFRSTYLTVFIPCSPMQPKV